MTSISPYQILVTECGSQLRADEKLYEESIAWCSHRENLVYFFPDKSWFEFDYDLFDWIKRLDIEELCRETVRPFLSRYGINASAQRFNGILNIVKEKHGVLEFPEFSNEIIFLNGVYLIEEKQFTDKMDYILDKLPAPRTWNRIVANYLSVEEEIDTVYYNRIKTEYPDVVEAVERHIHNGIFQITKDEQWLIIIGSKHTGKTTLISIFQEVCGKIAACITLQSLNDGKYGRYSCYRKRMVIKNDHPEGALDDSALEFFKNLVERQPLMIRQIYCSEFEWKHNGFCGILTTNKPPYIPPSIEMGSWFRRWEIREMNKLMPHDPAFKEGVYAEKDTIISRIIRKTYPSFWEGVDMDAECLRREKLYNYWREPIRFAIDDLVEFTRDYEFDFIPTDDMADVLIDWLIRHKFTAPPHKTILNQLLKVMTEKGIRRRQKQVNGVREQSFLGVRWYPQDDIQVETISDQSANITEPLFENWYLHTLNGHWLTIREIWEKATFKWTNITEDEVAELTVALEMKGLLRCEGARYQTIREVET